MVVFSFCGVYGLRCGLGFDLWLFGSWFFWGGFWFCFFVGVFYDGFVFCCFFVLLVCVFFVVGVVLWVEVNVFALCGFGGCFILSCLWFCRVE